MIRLLCSCGREINLRPELAGRRFRCPACNEILQAPGGNDPPPERGRSSRARGRDQARETQQNRVTLSHSVNPYSADDEWDFVEESVHDQRASVAAGGIQTAGTGMLIMAWAWITMGIALGLILLAMLPGGGQTRGNAIAVFVAVAGSIIIVCAGLMLLAGQLICLATPAATRGKELLIASLACTVLSGICRIGASLPTLSILSSLFSLAAFITLELYLKAVAHFVARHDLARRAVHVLAFFGGTVGASFLLLLVYWMVATSISGQPAIIAAVISVLAISIATIVLLVLHVKLLLDLGKECRL